MNNFSTFAYDGLWKFAKITETIAGSVTSTNQFVGMFDVLSESRDASGAVTANFFRNGQKMGASGYSYTLGYLGSIRELTDSSGGVRAQYAFDPFGRVTKLGGGLSSDFQFANYCTHSRSSLNLALYRNYSPALGGSRLWQTIEDNFLARLLNGKVYIYKIGTGFQAKRSA